MQSRLLKKASYAEEIKKLEFDCTLEDAMSSSCFARVVWEHRASIKTHTLDTVGIASTSGEYPTLRGIHVGDAEFWFNQLAEDYGRDAHAWEIKIYPVEGDYITDDPQYSIPDESGNKGESNVLITTRTTLKEGVDFDYERELTEDDLPNDERFEEDEDSSGNYGGYGGYNPSGFDEDEED